MKLYYSPAACSLAPHIVAREAGVPIELVQVDLPSHTLKRGGGDFYAINPRGYVPALELDDGTLITEVPAIMQYLADLNPAAELSPTGSFERIRLLEWLTFVGTELHKQFSPWLWHKDTAESTAQAVRQKIVERFVDLDRALAARPHLMGERFTIADAYAFTIVNWGLLLNMDLQAYPALAGYMKRIAARPKVKEALVAEGVLREAA